MTTIVKRSTPSRRKRLAVYAKTGDRCAACLKYFPRPDGYDGRLNLRDELYRDKHQILRLCSLDIDHIIPLGRGGTNDVSNLQPLCTQCNIRKGARA